MPKKDGTNYLMCTPLLPALARTATATGASKDWDYYSPQMLVALLDVGAASGTSPTLDVVVQGSEDGTTWETVGTMAQATAAGVQRANITKLAKYYRAVATIGGGTPSFTFGVYLLGAHPTHAPVAQVD